MKALQEDKSIADAAARNQQVIRDYVNSPPRKMRNTVNPTRKDIIGLAKLILSLVFLSSILFILTIFRYHHANTY